MAADIGWTTVASTTIMVAVVLVNAFLARRGADEVFGLVNLAKRSAGWVIPVVSLGTTVGLVRFVAGSKDEMQRRLVKGIASLLAISCVAVGSLILAPSVRSAARLTGLGTTSLTWAMWIYVCAMSLNGVSFALRRAELRQAAANWINVSANAILPLAVVVLAPLEWSAATLLLWMSVPIVVFHLFELLALCLLKGWLRDSSWERVWSETARLLRYSLARVPAALSVGVMMAIGATVAVRRGYPGSATVLLASLALVQGASAALQAVGIVILPRAAAMLPKGQERDLLRLAKSLLAGALGLAAVSVPAGLLIAGDLSVVWLGADFAVAAPAMRVIVLAVPAILLQVLLRSLLDATADPPWNTYAALAGLVVCAVLSLVVNADNPVFLAAAYSAGVWVQGLVLVAAVLVRFPSALPKAQLMSSMTVGAMSAAASAVVIYAFQQPLPRLVACALVSMAILALMASGRIPMCSLTGVEVAE